MKALPLRGFSVLAVERLLLGMLWPDTRWSGLAEVRRGCPCPPAPELFYCWTVSKHGFGPELLAVPMVFSMRNTECKLCRVTGWAGTGIEFLPCI